MTVGDLKDVIAAYFEKSAADLIVSGTDLGLRALNNARKTLERQRDWFNQQVVAQLLVDPDNGALLGNASLYLDEDTGVSVKSVETFYLVDESASPTGLVPIYHHGKHTVATKSRKRLSNRRSYLSEDLRYPSDDLVVNTPYATTNRVQVFMHGGGVWLYPRPEEAQPVAFDCQAWMDDYTDDLDEDWMLEAAPDYFQWKAIIELNNLWGAFVAGSDGNLPPPKDLMSEALASLIEWDNMLYEAGRMPRMTNA